MDVQSLRPTTFICAVRVLTWHTHMTSFIEAVVARQYNCWFIKVVHLQTLILNLFLIIYYRQFPNKIAHYIRNLQSKIPTLCQRNLCLLSNFLPGLFRLKHLFSSINTLLNKRIILSVSDIFYVHNGSEKGHVLWPLLFSFLLQILPL